MSDEPGRTAHDARLEILSVRGEGLRVIYRNRTVLDVGAVSVPAGCTYALLGPSGAGKSTLLRVLGLLERPTEGRVAFGDREMSDRDLRARRSIAAVFQKPYLLRGTIGHNVGYGLRVRRVAAVERRRRISEALSRVGLTGWEARSAGTLSGGEAQRVALARALVLQPSFLLLDEPLSYLDPLIKRNLSQEFAQILASERLTAFYVTHDQDEAAVVADIMGVMRDGRLVAEGDPDEILGLPTDDWLAGFVGMEPPLRGRVVSASNGEARIDCRGVAVRARTMLEPHTHVLLAVRPEDITLRIPCDDPARGTTDNEIDCVISSILPQGGSVRVVVEREGVRLAAAISRSAAATLDPSEGARVVAGFKASAVRVRAARE